MMTFYKFLLKLEAGETPPPPPGGADPMGGGTPPPAGGDPLGGMGGGGGPDPMGGAGAAGAPAAGPRKAINVTTWEDALKLVLGHAAHREPEKRQSGKSSDSKGDREEKKKPKSLIQ